MEIFYLTVKYSLTLKTTAFKSLKIMKLLIGTWWYARQIIICNANFIFYVSEIAKATNNAQSFLVFSFRCFHNLFISNNICLCQRSWAAINSFWKMLIDFHVKLHAHFNRIVAGSFSPGNRLYHVCSFWWIHFLLYLAGHFGIRQFVFVEVS